MVLAIKIRDNIKVFGLGLFKFSLGLGYIDAQNEIISVFNINNDVDFDVFQNSIFDNFEFNPSKMIQAYNLYYLADSKDISKKILEAKAYNLYQISSNPAVTDKDLIPLENQLNYFGFNIKKYPTNAQFTILNDLKNKNIIESFWIEGEVCLPLISQIATLPPINPILENPIVAIQEVVTTEINDFEKDLNYSQIDNRGLGATIVDFEEEATRDLSIINNSNIFLKNFLGNSPTISFLGGNNLNGDFKHQMNTFQVLFAQPPINPTFVQLNGICPKASVLISTIKPLIHDNYMGAIRKTLTELQNLSLQNAILLFEFETDIYQKNRTNPSGRFPITIYSEINNRLAELVRLKNHIILEGAGNIKIDFDTLKNAPWKIKTGAKYTDLTVNNPNVIMVGGVQKDINGNFIKNEDCNTSKNIDVLMYTDVILADQENNAIRYGGSSGAVAVCGGIITFLQGKALRGAGSSPQGLPTGIDNTKRVLTVKIIKTLFQKTFNKGRSAGILLSPFKLEELWIDCQKELNLQPSQHQ